MPKQNHMTPFNFDKTLQIMWSGKRKERGEERKCHMSLIIAPLWARCQPPKRSHRDSSNTTVNGVLEPSEEVHALPKGDDLFLQANLFVARVNQIDLPIFFNTWNCLFLKFHPLTLNYFRSIIFYFLQNQA
jgi:hypothetical protein